MSNLNIDFERFLTEEANRQFKAVPEEDGVLHHFGHEAKSNIEEQAFVPHRGEQEVDVKSIEFDLQNPPTSFNDTAFYDGKIPPSVAGNGKQPGIYNPSVGPDSFGRGAVEPKEKLPFQETLDHYIEVPDLFKDFNFFSHSPQLPTSQQQSPFYFTDIDHIKSPWSSPEPSINTGVKETIQNAGLPLLDVAAIRQDFPILNEYVNGRKLVWLDNAATTQKPQVVIDRLSYFYKHENSNIHRAAHELAARATDAYEEARNIIKSFLNASSSNEIIFTRGTTESINLVANSWGEQNLGPDDEIIISHLEHHANIVPWQQLSQKKGFKIRVIPVDDAGNLLVDEYIKLLSPKTKLVSFTHVSNALGTITPAKKIIDLAHQVGAKVLMDGAQSVSHIRIDLQTLRPDFFVFSGHKIFGPTGIGVLYGTEELLNSMQPYQSGGNMIQDVTFEKTTFHKAPNRFEAGTGNIADAVGLGAAIRYVQSIGIDNIYQYEHALLGYATALLKQIRGIKLIGTAQEKTSVLSFTLQGYDNNEVGQALNEVGIAVRTGHHCAQPILRRLGYESSVRPSLAFYNTCQEIDLLASTLDRLAWKR